MLKPKQTATDTIARDIPDQQGTNDPVAINGHQSAAAIRQFMLDSIGTALGVDGRTLDPTADVTSYGLDSVASFTLTLELSEFLQQDLPASLIWEFPTIAELAEELGQ